MRNNRNRLFHSKIIADIHRELFMTKGKLNLLRHQNERQRKIISGHQISEQKLKEQVVSLRAQIETLRTENIVLSKTHTELKECQLTMHEMTQNLRDMITFTDLTGRITYNSPVIREFLGYDPEYLNGLSIFDLIHPDDRQHSLREFNEAIAQRQPRTAIIRFRHKDGHYLWLESSGNYIPDDAGGISKLIFSSRDISERLSLYEMIGKQQQLLQMITENMRDMLSVVTPDLRFTYVSASNFKVLGYAPKDLTGISLLSILHPDDAHNVAQLFSLLRQTGMEETATEVRCRRSDGSYLWVETVINVVFSTPGTIEHIILSSRECTERKRIEAELELERYYSREIIDKNIIPFFEIDLDGYMHDANQAMADMLGRPLHELKPRPIPLEAIQKAIGRSGIRWEDLVSMDKNNTFIFKKNSLSSICNTAPDSAERKALLSLIRSSFGPKYSDLVGPKHARTSWNAFKEVFETKRSRSTYDLPITGKDERIGETSINLRYENERIIGYFGFIRDVTEIRKTEQEKQMVAHIISNTVDRTDTIVYQLDRDGYMTYTNNAIHKRRAKELEMLKTDHKRLHYLEFVVPEYRAFVRDHYEKLLAEHALLLKNNPHVRAADIPPLSPFLEFPVQIGESTLWISQAITVELDETTREITRVNAIAHNITDRKLAELEREKADKQKERAEQELRNSHEQMKKVLDQLHEAAIIQGSDGITLINEAFANMVGLTKKDILGSHPVEYVPEDFIPAFLDQYIPGTSPIPEEMTLLSTTKGTIPVKPSHSLLTEGQQTDEPLHLWTFLDLTERKERINSALRDELTGLPQRGLFKEYFMNAVAEAKRAKNAGLPYFISMFFIDINKFKEYNDKLGYYEGGDPAIKTAGRIASQCMRETDHFARWGGDEFIGLLENIDGGTENVLQKIMASALVKDLRFSIGVYHDDLTALDLSDQNKLFDECIRKITIAEEKAKQLSALHPVSVTINDKTLNLTDNYCYYYGSDTEGKPPLHKRPFLKFRQMSVLNKQYLKAVWKILRG